MRITIYLLLWAIAIAFAMRKGGDPERGGAAILFAMTIGVMALRPLFPVQYGQIDLLALAVDSLTAAAFLALALRANRFWPFWVCSAQIIALSGHFARQMDPQIDGMAYGILIRLPAYIQCVALLVGTELHRRRVKTSGSYPSWLG